jgi:hypothetical protein
MSADALNKRLVLRTGTYNMLHETFCMGENHGVCYVTA